MALLGTTRPSDDQSIHEGSVPWPIISSRHLFIWQLQVGDTEDAEDAEVGANCHWSLIQWQTLSHELSTLKLISLHNLQDAFLEPSQLTQWNLYVSYICIQALLW